MRRALSILSSSSGSCLSALLAAFAFGCGGSVSGDPGATTDTGVANADTGFVATDSGVDAPSDTTPPPDSGDPDADAAPLDHGAPSTTYPAFVPAMGEIRDNGGGVLSAPVVVTVTWPGDPDVDGLEAFGDQVGATTYWSAIGTDYGVGKATSGATNHVRLTTPAPTTWADTDVDAWIADHAKNVGKDGFPAPTDQTIWVLYLPDTVSLTYAGSDMCSQGIGGFHTNTTISTASGPLDVAYAIIGNCSSGGLGDRTSTASHELIEASTDPHPQDGMGFYGFTQATAAWDLFDHFQSEVADACENSGASYYEDIEGTFDAWVQRSWSNSAGKAGHNPCVPLTTAVFYNTTPLALENVVVDLSSLGGDSITRAKGIHIKKGETKTFPIGFYSDGDTGGPWTIKAVEGTPFSPTSPARLKISIDKTSGQNGEKAWITVTVNAVDTTRADLVTVTSQSSTGKGRHSMPILIGSD